jgi:hypothetical protein
MYEFNTEKAAIDFISRCLPSNQKNIHIWLDDSDETRQPPTWAGKAEKKNKWWDANKNPFYDRYDIQDETGERV